MVFRPLKSLDVESGSACGPRSGMFCLHAVLLAYYVSDWRVVHIRFVVDPVSFIYGY
jgi:hypothetical protein